MSASHNRILLKSDFSYQNEGIAGTGTILPGMGVELQADGNYDPVPTAASSSGLLIAIEDALQGKTVDDLYTVAEPVFFAPVAKGDEVNVLVTSGENIVLGDTLILADGGKFVEGATNGFSLIALEAPGALGADALVACRVD